MSQRLVAALAATVIVLAACAVPNDATLNPTVSPEPAGLKVLAATTVMADIAQNVAGDRVAVGALLPIGSDPHSFQPTPADLRKVADSSVLIINGAGLESFLTKVLDNAGGQRSVIESIAGVPPRTRMPGEPAPDEADAGPDPHAFLDPIAIQTYADNIAAGLSRADPAGTAVYAENAATYKGKLGALDQELRGILAAVPAAGRLLVTDHDDMGYFADRYDFKIVGMVLPGFSSEAAPSAQEMAALVKTIKASGAQAVFTDAGANPKLAEQVATEAGVQVASDLYTHSLSGPEGPAATYVDMMRHNARVVARVLGGG